MKNSYEDRLLHALLDKYEHSLAFRQDQPTPRRILLKFYDGGSSDFPDYDIESSDRRLQYNDAVQNLARLDLVKFQWLKGEAGHILEKVWLNLDHLAEAYKFAQRTPRKDFLDEVYLELLALQELVHSVWAKAYCTDAAQWIEGRRKLPGLIPEAAEERRRLFQAIAGLEAENSGDITQRVFSMKYLDHSKAFEQGVRSRLGSILRRYLEHDDDVREEDLFRQVGLVKYPEQFEFCGGLRLSDKEGTTDFSALGHGSGFSFGDLKEGTLSLAPGVIRILTIENRANYFDYLQRHRTREELVIYHGGQYSPSKQAFFLAVRGAMKQGCTWAHWGDIDYGGFSMLARLRREILPDISPHRMDLEEITAYQAMAGHTSPEYAARLLRLSRQAELADCSACLLYLVEHRLRLEQEAMLID